MENIRAIINLILTLLYNIFTAVGEEDLAERVGSMIVEPLN